MQLHQPLKLGDVTYPLKVCAKAMMKAHLQKFPDDAKHMAPGKREKFIAESKKVSQRIRLEKQQKNFFLAQQQLNDVQEVDQNEIEVPQPSQDDEGTEGDLDEDDLFGDLG